MPIPGPILFNTILHDIDGRQIFKKEIVCTVSAPLGKALGKCKFNVTTIKMYNVYRTVIYGSDIRYDAF